MDSEAIRDFWEAHPCGQSLVTEVGQKINDFRDFFLKYDQFRYSTEGHILANLEKVNFKDKNVLELGLGQAADGQRIIEGGAYYYGLDITRQACRRAALRFKIFDKRYKLIVCGDATAIPFRDNYFDIIYSHGTLHHIPDIDKAAGELGRVLKKDGKLIMMLYARGSLNYYLSILLIRRVLLVFLLFLDKITNKRLIKNSLLRKHIENVSGLGLFNYLSTDSFLSKNTDGPENPYSRVYSPKEAKRIFKGLHFEGFEHHFLNKKHLPFLRLLPKSLQVYLSRRLGWHLWCYGSKI